MSESNDQKWCFSWDNSLFNSGSFDSKKAAIEQAKSEAKELGGKEFVYIAKSKLASNEAMFPDADVILEHMYCQAEDQGGDFAEDYPDAPEEAEKELTEGLHNLLTGWCKKHSVTPSFYTVYDAVKVKL